MDDSKLIQLAISTSIIGLIVLTVISLYGDYPNQSSLEQLSSNIIDVKITGTVGKVNQFGKISVIDLVSPKTDEVLIFEDGKLNLRKGDYVQILGELQEDQIVAHQIEVLE